MKKLFLASVLVSLTISVNLAFAEDKANAKANVTTKTPQLTTSPNAKEQAGKSPETPKKDSPKKDSEEELKKLDPGVIASSVPTMGQGNIPNVLSGAPGEKPNPIGGRISFLKGKCQAVLVNNSKDETYDISFEVSQISANGRKRASSYSATLKPKQEITRLLTCSNDETSTLQVTLKSGTEVKTK